MRNIIFVFMTSCFIGCIIPKTKVTGVIDSVNDQWCAVEVNGSIVYVKINKEVSKMVEEGDVIYIDFKDVLKKRKREQKKEKQK